MNRKYDLEERTFQFARKVRLMVRSLPQNIQNYEDGKQLIRSSGSVGANYIEANESISQKDYYYRVKICRKESKESIYWLKLIDTGSKSENIEMKDALLNEAFELMKIFGAIISKSKKG